MNSKTKRILICCGLAAVCVGALSLIFNRADASAEPQPVSSDTSSEIVMQTPNPILAVDSESSTAPAFVPSSGAVASAPLTVESKPVSKPPKPTPPASSALTNKTKKPTYSTPPKAKTGTGSITKSDSKPSGGKAGQIYVPGFGWQDPAPKGKMGTVGNPGDKLSGDKVGTMD